MNGYEDKNKPQLFTGYWTVAKKVEVPNRRKNKNVNSNMQTISFQLKNTVSYCFWDEYKTVVKFRVVPKFKVRGKISPTLQMMWWMQQTAGFRATWKYVQCLSVADPGFTIWRRQPPRWVRQHINWPNFSRKLRENKRNWTQWCTYRFYIKRED